MPRSLDHIALVVRDPARSAQLFAQVFDDARVQSGEGDHDTLIWLGGVCLVLARGEPPATRNGDHIAFAVSKVEQLACAERLREAGIECLMARGDSALYFDDYDNHVFELDVIEGG
ncbi:VOC family protein [Rhodanobacter sp. DHB23]|uniref:VOC family protein n=1 Tax=Rhodanobacter sp. DHB23 TaxID=2775923 RepID=UPI0017843EC7|nr:VOC family protein [Rhodanobacter sp. DHB23]MBD8872670.1 VOC family protein [Rhodanobacter sp. DHB23]